MPQNRRTLAHSILRNSAYIIKNTKHQPLCRASVRGGKREYRLSLARLSSPRVRCGDPIEAPTAQIDESQVDGCVHELVSGLGADASRPLLLVALHP